MFTWFFGIVEQGSLLEDGKNDELAPLLGNHVAETSEKQKLGHTAILQEHWSDVVTCGCKEKESTKCSCIIKVAFLSANKALSEVSVVHDFCLFINSIINNLYGEDLKLTMLPIGVFP